MSSRNSTVNACTKLVSRVHDQLAKYVGTPHSQAIIDCEMDELINSLKFEHPELDREDYTVRIEHVPPMNLLKVHYSDSLRMLIDESREAIAREWDDNQTV